MSDLRKLMSAKNMQVALKPPSARAVGTPRPVYDDEGDSKMVLDEDVNELPYDDRYDPTFEKRLYEIPQLQPGRTLRRKA